MIAEFNEDVTASLDDSDGMKDDENSRCRCKR